LAEVVPENFVLSDKNIAEVQKRMPNRNGMTEKHGLWDLKGRPDVVGTLCMSNCATELKITSFLPESARDAHGNLKEQHRPIGPARAIDTSRQVLLRRRPIGRWWLRRHRQPQPLRLAASMLRRFPRRPIARPAMPRPPRWWDRPGQRSPKNTKAMRRPPPCWPRRSSPVGQEIGGQYQCHPIRI